MKTTPVWMCAAFCAFSSTALVLGPSETRADTALASGDGWEVFTSGRVNAFHSYARGDGFPRPFVDETGATLHTVRGGGFGETAPTERVPVSSESMFLTQGKIEGDRIKSGFVGNVLSFGVRRSLSERTKLTAFISLWAVIESEDRRKYRPNPADIREGFLKIEGNWGSLVAGRSLTLFSRGATEINFLYGHGFNLGYPGNMENVGPAAGHIGFGVLASGFAAGVAYSTASDCGISTDCGLLRS